MLCVELGSCKLPILFCKNTYMWAQRAEIPLGTHSVAEFTGNKGMSEQIELQTEY